MYLKELRLSNFRKYESLTVEFKNGLNVLIGENDSGKTAIIDAIRYLLNTKSFESVRFESRDFYQNDSSVRADNLSIIGVFSGFTDAEAANFLEWGYFNTANDFELRLILKVNLQSSNRIVWDLKAGPENAETQMDGNARELLQVTYLKPLRDAETELTPGYRSRLAQILQSHKDFQKTKDNTGQTEPHKLETIIQEANIKIDEYLSGVKTDDKGESDNIISQINTYVDSFTHHDDKRSASIKISDPELSKILRSLGLELENNSSGLGTLNKLFMAAELLHLKTDPYNSIRLCLIEELEAHLHPQAQLRVISTLQKLSLDKKTQFILTTHSTTIGSSIDLQNIILCKNGVFPMWKGQTKLAIGDYKFLQRFLDSTKANLFFAKGVIMVEGDAENILIPTLAELIGMPLHEYGVSIVNVNSTAFLRYANIFIRAKGKELEIPVSVITDLDVRALEYYEDLSNETKPPTYHKVGDSLFSIGEKKYNTEKLHGNIYSNKDELNDAIKEHLLLKRMPKGMNDIIKNWPKEVLDNTNIDDVRLAKKKTIESKFSSHVKGFLNTKWTLEYDLALSEELREYFAQAVEVAKKVKSSEGYFHKLYDEQDNFNLPRVDVGDGDESIESVAKAICSNGDKFEVAYEIFKPFVSSNKPSKAVTAQVFSEILIKNKDVLKNIIKTDSSLKYIIDAIEYACGVGDKHE